MASRIWYNSPLLWNGECVACRVDELAAIPSGPPHKSRAYIPLPGGGDSRVWEIEPFPNCPFSYGFIVLVNGFQILTNSYDRIAHLHIHT